MPVAASRSRFCGIEHRAAAGRDDDAVERAERRDHVALALAKARLAFFLEDVWNVHAAAALDLGVAVEELLVEQRREPLADRGLARAHGSDQVDVRALGRHGRQSSGCRSRARSGPKKRRPALGRPSSLRFSARGRYGPSGGGGVAQFPSLPNGLTTPGGVLVWLVKSAAEPGGTNTVVSENSVP